MKFEKPVLSFEEQFTLLESRGMLIPDRRQALFYLSHLNYYRLEAYWLPYEVSRDPHQFRKGASFAQVLDRYLFDREFRLLTLDAIERIEISFRTQWAFHMSSNTVPMVTSSMIKVLGKMKVTSINVSEISLQKAVEAMKCLSNTIKTTTMKIYRLPG